MKSNSIFFTTLMLAAPLALCLQGGAFAQATGGTNPAPPAQKARAGADTNDSTFRDNVDFYFPGGTPVQFLRAVDEQYHVDWMSVADIPGDMRQVLIPRLRLSRESLDRIPARGRGLRAGRGGGGGFGVGAGLDGRGGGGGGGVVTRPGGDVVVGLDGRGGFGTAAVVAPASGDATSAPDPAALLARLQAQRDPVEALVALYNNLGQAMPDLGQLRVVGDLAKPSIVMFRSTLPPSIRPDFKLKAFALKGIPESEWAKLESVASQELAHLFVIQGSNQAARNIDVSLHPDTGLLIVLGPESVLEAAESLVTAWRANYLPAAQGR